MNKFCNVRAASYLPSNIIWSHNVFRSSFGGMCDVNDTSGSNYCEFSLYLLIHKKTLNNIRKYRFLFPL